MTFFGLFTLGTKVEEKEKEKSVKEIEFEEEAIS